MKRAHLIAAALLASASPALGAVGTVDADLLVGTPGRDVIAGDYGADALRGLGGPDLLLGGHGADRLLGGPGRDDLRGGFDDDLLDGGPGADTLRGGLHGDRLRGGPGSDRLLGGPGDDTLSGGPGSDRIWGGDGDDRIAARDGRADRIWCGEGEDVVVADPIDAADLSCEVVRPVQAAALGATPARPVPLGSAARMPGGWDLSVIGLVPDATAAVLAASEWNVPPPTGRAYVMARVRARHAAGAPDGLDGAFRLRALADGVAYTTFGDSCGVVVPDAVPEGDVFAGTTVEGNVCWSLPAQVVSRVSLVDEPFASSSRRYFALR